MAPGSRISGHIVRADFNALESVLLYTRAAHRLGLWKSERLLIERFFPELAAPLLEAGCGAGRATFGLWELGYRNLTAFDFAEELLDQARHRATELGIADIRFHHADATKPPQLRALLPPALALERQPIVDASLVPRISAPAACLGQSNVLRYKSAAPLPLQNQGTCHVIGDKARGTATAHNSRSTVHCRAAAPSVSPSGASPEENTSAMVGVHGPPPATHRPLFAGAFFLFNGLMQIPGRRNRRRALRALAAVMQPGAPLLFTTHDRDEPDELHLWRAEAKRWAAGKQDPRLHEYGDRYFDHEHGRTFMHLPDRAETLADLVATGWKPEYDAMRADIARESPAVKDFSDNCRFWLVRRGD